MKIKGAGMTSRMFLMLCTIMTLVAARENPFFAPKQEQKVQVADKKTHVSRPEVIKTEIVPVIEVPKQHQKAAAIQSAEKKKSVVKQSGEKREVANFKYIRFIFTEGEVQVETKDTLIKHFALPKKKLIVMDFEQKADFATKRRALATEPFKELRIGVHEGYYRVVLKLGETRKYGVSKGRYGYKLVLE
jgi:hypothetical protein